MIDISATDRRSTRRPPPTGDRRQRTHRRVWARRTSDQHAAFRAKYAERAFIILLLVVVGLLVGSDAIVPVIKFIKALF